MSDEANQAMFDDALQQLRDGNDDGGLQLLMDLGPPLIPLAEPAFDQELDPQVRTSLVHAVWQQQIPQALPLLERALYDEDPHVWKEAIDGLVALRTPEVRQLLLCAKAKRGDDRPRGERLSFGQWIEDGLAALELPRD